MPDILAPAALAVPTFTRLSDYFGAWLYEPDRFHAQWRALREMNFALHMATAQPPRSTVDMAPAKGGKSIAVIRAAGTLMKAQSSMGGTSSVQLRRDIRQAAADPNVSAILLAIDSPGGTVAGTADLAGDVKAAAKKKPVWAHVDDLAASAAYWLASQADVIYANSPTALIGSIGTFQVVYDESGAAEAQGVKTLVFKTGPLKATGVPGAPVTEEQQQHLQKMVEDVQVHFDAAVKAGRGMNQTQLNAVRSGGVFSASEALDLKLIDGIRPLDKTLAELSSAA